MNEIKVWPHLTIFAVLCALVAGVAVALWVKHQQTVSAEVLPNVARIQRIDGEVALNEFDSNEANSDTEWTAATPNQPFSIGDRIYTRDNSHAGLAFSGRNYARLNPNSSLDVLSLADRRTQLALRNGSALFDVGYLAPGELFEVATPYGAVDLYEPGLYSIGLDNDGAIISVLSGLAQVVGLGGSGQISKGEMLTLLGQTAANIVLSRLDGGDAGYLVDDYYGYQYPQLYDGRYRDYNAYLNDPYYYDPYRRNVSYQYVSSYIPGINDLDYYGDWNNISGYGYGWRPRVDSGWTPYQQGYWMTDYPYGPTWVSTEPWGYAPYHYGRWANVSNQWYWIPDSINTTPIYSPALVAFIPQTQSNEIGWVPLGPGDAYVPRYYDEDWRPTYLSRADVSERQFLNLDVPGAVTIVPVEDFTRLIDRDRVKKVDRQMLAHVRPVLDPLSLTPLRNAAIHSAWARGKIDLPRGIRKKLRDTRVLTSSELASPRFRRDLARTRSVEAVPDRVRNQKLKFRDERKEEKGQRVGRAGGEVKQRELDSARQQRHLLDQPRSADRFEQRGSQRGLERNGRGKRARDLDLARGQQMRLLEQQRRQTQIELWKSRQSASQQAQGERIGRPERKQKQTEARQQNLREVRQPVLIRAEPKAKAQRQEWRRPEIPRAQERPKVREMAEGRQRNADQRRAVPAQIQQVQPRPKAEPRPRDEGRQNAPENSKRERHGAKGRKP